MNTNTTAPAGVVSSTEFGAWHPIETAPKDGTRVLLFWPLFGNNEHQEFGCWDTQPHNNKPKPFWSGDMERVYGIGWYRKYTPTHWMLPLKAPNVAINLPP